MRCRLPSRILLTWIALGLLAAIGLAAEGPPMPAALDRAAVCTERLDRILDDSLILGNGDLNGLLFRSSGGLVLRVTKNDVWDARLDTSEDPPLLHVDIKANRWTGCGIVPPSWDKPYPCPRACGEVVLGAGATEPRWGPIRAEGAKNSWQWREGVAVMAIEGRPGASNGYCNGPLDFSTDRYRSLRVRLSGSLNAQYYVDVMSPTQKILLSSKWIKTPAKPEDRVFALPPGETVGSIVLYTWTIDGRSAENRFEKLELTGPAGSRTVDLRDLSPIRPVRARLDLRRAVAEVRGMEKTSNSASVRALAQRNVFLLDAAGPARLRPVPASYLPAAEEGHTGEIRWLRQRLPGDTDWPGMSFAVALADGGTRKAVAVVTSLEAKDFLAAAVALAESTLADDPQPLVAEHEAQWRRFWSASGVELEAPDLTAIWYRNLYFFRCVSKPGVEAVGLYASLVNDNPPWHGSHTLNYNSEQTFWPAYNTNHVELAEPYERMISRYLPRARWFARQTYGCGGAHLPHNVFTHEIPDPETCRSKNHRMHAATPFAESLCVSGWAVQNLWLHYQYAPDREYLRQVAYPAVRDVAVFYADFMDQCKSDAAGRVVLGPTFCPEHRGLGERNCTADLAFMRYTFQAAIEGATVLGCDQALIERFRAELARLPDYPTTREAMPMVTDVQDGVPIDYNIAVPVLPVFPGDQVTWFSDGTEKALFRRTIERVRWNGYNSSIIMSVARARLSLPGTWQWVQRELGLRSRPNGTITLLPGDGCGHFTEQFAAAGAVSELLLQSVGGALRVMPAWPADKSARFENLRAQGGFLVSAEQSDGHLRQVEVKSTVGGRLRLLSPWPSLVVSRTSTPSTAVQPGKSGIVELETQAGECLRFNLAQPPNTPK